MWCGIAVIVLSYFAGIVLFFSSVLNSALYFSFIFPTWFVMVVVTGGLILTFKAKGPKADQKTISKSGLQSIK